MKIGLVMCGPDVAYGPLALLSGTFEEKAQKAAALGYDGIELMVRDPAQLDVAAIRATLGAVGLEVPQVVTGELFGADGLCLVTSDDALARRAEERLRAVIRLAAELGAMVNIGRVRGQSKFVADPAEGWRLAVERLGRLAAYAATQGVRIALEPINRYETDFVLTCADGLQLIERMGQQNVGLMLDLFHMNIEEVSIEAALRLAGDKLWHVHIADSNRRYPGSGHLPFAPIWATLREMGYTGYLSAELLPLPDPDTAAARTMAFLRAQMGLGDTASGQS